MSITPEMRKEMRSIYRAELKKSNDDLMNRIKELLVGIVEDEEKKAAPEKKLTKAQIMELYNIGSESTYKRYLVEGMPSHGYRHNRYFLQSEVEPWYQEFINR